jgi:hypothetical protein
MKRDKARAADRPQLSAASTELLAAGMTRAIEIYNSFHAGRHEARLMQLIATVKELTHHVSDDRMLQDPVQVTLPDGNVQSVPYELFVFLLASTKHLGDLTAGYGRLGRAAVQPQPRLRRRPGKT